MTTLDRPRAPDQPDQLEYSLFGLSPHTHRPHPLHDPGRTYAETNCYSDVLVELVHARGDEPLACLVCVLELDFEGDQLTFFKPEPHLLRALYGLDVHEMQSYRSLVAHAVEQLQRGASLLVEVDGWFLPDTAATSYGREHVKTTIALEAVDEARQRAHYFHNGGLHLLAGADFRGALRVDVEPGSVLLPPYTELARWSGVALTGNALRRASAAAARQVLARRPVVNPFLALGERLPRELEWLAAGSPDRASAYAFATARMGGSAAGVAAAYAAWLLGERGDAAQQAFDRVGAACKTLSFRLARRRPFDAAPLIGAAARDWDEALRALASALPVD